MKLTLEQARAMGYCVISRRFNTAARITRADWLEHLHSIGHTGMRRNAGSASWYRRCVSMDRITIPHLWVGQLPNSDDPKAPIDYRELPA